MTSAFGITARACDVQSADFSGRYAMPAKTEAQWSTDEEFWGVLQDVIFDAHRMRRGEREAAELAKLAGLTSPSMIVDMCCGPGRHALPLARRGHRVVGVDTTSRFLDTA